MISSRHVSEDVSPRDLREALGAFPTGVTVISTRNTDSRPIGVTVNSFSSVSLDPPLILWCLRNNSASFPAFRDNPRFAVSILSEDQEHVSKHFAAPIYDKFSGNDFESGMSGIPLVVGAAGWLECVKDSQHRGGDHTIFVGRVVGCSVSGKLPLMFCGGSYLHSSAAFGNACWSAASTRSAGT